jgi:hypothetical protein
MMLASQQHHQEVGITTTSTQGWKYLAQGWHRNNISTKLEIFSTSFTSQQHQHEAINLQHDAGINNISMNMEIFNTRLASQQHHYEARNIQHEAGINNIVTSLEIFSTRMESTTST